MNSLANEDNFSVIMEETEKYAMSYHKDQKYGDYGYLYHLKLVHEIVNDLYDFPDFTEKELEVLHIGAYLHDLLEDTSCTDSDLNRMYGNPLLTRTIQLVTDVLRDPETDLPLTRKQKHKYTYPRLANAVKNGNDLALALKLADRIANVQFSKIENPKIFNMYSNEHIYFRNTLIPSSTERLVHAWETLDNIFLTF